MSHNLALSFRKLSLYGARPLPLVSVVAQRGLKTNSTSKSANAKVPKEKTTTKKVKAAPKPKIEKPRYKDSSTCTLCKIHLLAVNYTIYLTNVLQSLLVCPSDLILRGRSTSLITCQRFNLTVRSACP